MRIKPVYFFPLVLAGCSFNAVGSVIGEAGKAQRPSSASGRAPGLRQPASLPTLSTPDADELPPVPPTADEPISAQPTASSPGQSANLTAPALPPPAANSPPPAAVSTPAGEGGSLSVGLLWDSPFETQATRRDIASLRLTVTGSEILKLWKQPLQSSLNDPRKRLRLDRLPSGEVEIQLEALDASQQNIGTARVSGVLIRSGQVSRVNMQLQLIDTVTDEAGSASGQLAIDVAILDGKTIVRKKSLVPEGGYLLFENGSVGCAASQPAPDLPLPGGDLPNLGAALAEPGEIGGSSADLPFVFQDNDLSASSAGNSCDASLPTRQPDSAVLALLSFSRSRIQLQAGTRLELATLLQARNGRGALPASEVAWSAADDHVARLDGQGRLMALASGTTRIFAQAQGQRAALEVSVTARPVPAPPVPDFVVPRARLQLSAARLQRGQLLKLTAIQAQGSIYSYYWTLTGGQLAAQTLAPASEMPMLRSGNFTARLILIGTNGQQYPAGEQNITVED